MRPYEKSLLTRMMAPGCRVLPYCMCSGMRSLCLGSPLVHGVQAWFWTDGLVVGGVRNRYPVLVDIESIRCAGSCPTADPTRTADVMDWLALDYRTKACSQAPGTYTTIVRDAHKHRLSRLHERISTGLYFEQSKKCTRQTDV